MSRKIFAVAVVLLASHAAAGGWSKGVRNEFVGSCVHAAPGQNITEASARVYCNCVGDTLEAKYTDQQFVKESVDRSPAFNADIQGATKDCAKHIQFATKPGQKGWSSTFRSAFIGSCVGGATEKGADEKKAEKYCTCMGTALEKGYDENEFTKASFSPTDKFNVDLQGAAKVCVKDLK